MHIVRIEDFLPYYQNIRARTRRVIDRIPPEHVDWTHQSGKFTLGDLVRHLAGAERFMFVENVSGRPSRYPGHGRGIANGYDAAVRYMDALHAESLEMLSQLTETQLAGKCETPAGTKITAWKWLRAMIEHEVHHRGQIYLMLGMLGVNTPPLYGLTAEEVLDLSVHDSPDV